MSGGVFISYRREDSAAFAGRIYDRLVGRLGKQNIFFDVDNIPPGLDFVDILADRVGKCDALVAVIGKDWIALRDKDARRRLDDPNDFVRIEIEAALRRGVRVIPVLVDGAAMPRAEDLPESLRNLVRRQGIEISHTRFDSDVDRLTRAISLLEEEFRQREATAAEHAARREQEKQARRLAQAAARQEAEAEQASREERDRQDAATKAEEARRARQREAEDEKQRTQEAVESLRKAQEEQEARDRAERERVQAEAQAAKEDGAISTDDVSPVVGEPSRAVAPERALAEARRRSRFMLAAIAGTAILAAALSSLEFRSRQGNSPTVASNSSATQSHSETPAPSDLATIPSVDKEATKPSPAIQPPSKPESTQSPAATSPLPPAPNQPTPLPAAPTPAAEKSVPSRAVIFATLTPQRERELQAKDIFKECVDCPEMVVVPSGEFAMGSSATDIRKGDANPNEGPQHRVTIRARFALARHEVTRDEFETFVAASRRPIGESCYTLEGGRPQERDGRSFLTPGFAQAGDHPAVCVSWLDATAYAEWLSHATGKTYRLPSEAEYEYLARAGSDLRYGSTNDASDLCRFVNGADQTARQAGLPGNLNFLDCTDGYPYTAPVGAFPPNSFGLSDLLGNVWEWTAECYREDYRTASSDGAARTSDLCVERAVRGGSWSSPALLLRTTVRTKAKVNDRIDDLGFRVVREMAP